ncbi:hypothetical protein G6F64_014190 [Rhizopus arrhizus]|uniref:Uncharacterized protein n=1 Tax=Rhizopus oryzae TaxID=64495 RepID=A0A9P6WU56_RHIOR|nr:hypothetical protein G6F64_014190 [Rhizopus arrhizus]
MATQPALQLRAGNACGDRHHQRAVCLCQCLQRLAHIAQHLRLHRQQPGAALRGGIGGVVMHLHAEVGGQRLAQCGHRFGHVDVRGGHAPADQAGNQAAGHVAAADEGDGISCHGSLLGKRSSEIPAMSSSRKRSRG